MLQPAKRRAYAQTGDNVFTPVERELIFDIVSSSTLNFGKTLDSNYSFFLFNFKFQYASRI